MEVQKVEGIANELPDKSLKKGPKNIYLNKIDIRAYTMIIGLIAIWILFSILTDGTFLSARNISNLTMQMAVVAILGVGMVLVIVTGHIDLSVGSLVGLVGGCAAALMVWNGWGTVQTIIAVLALGIVAGALQGFATVYLNVPAFIVTLGGMMVFKGILLGITEGVSIAPMNDSYKLFGQAYVTNATTYFFAFLVIAAMFVLEFKKQKNRKNMGLEHDSKAAYTKSIIISILILGFVYVMVAYKGLPVPAFIMLALVALFTFLAEKTKFGRSIYAIGGNLQAAVYSGIKVKKIVLTVFALNGLMAAVAGIILSARLNTGSPSAGTMMELDAIAAAVIGGTSLMGGRGRVYGAILGALIMASLDNGMSLLNIEAFWQYIVKGGILVLAVWFDVYTKKKGR
ncbi:xylose ABC transporter permease [Siminovitchia terrae]|uniref:Xylose transport system permease protein XylH n=1 Tax=Siminovitchia terrae TaxID=1914933 RepID=A0ABQ4L364_SIMTE|nr:sugar ABC transporter permease [Siminovitchia terrae]GIN93884.1 xylose ABC transporter permease [Siminovitchia terrae]GIN98369.1 xylose ABC transporter permease [Siminovitchia terrae]